MPLQDRPSGTLKIALENQWLVQMKFPFQMAYLLVLSCQFERSTRTIAVGIDSQHNCGIDPRVFRWLRLNSKIRSVGYYAYVGLPVFATVELAVSRDERIDHIWSTDRA